MRAYDKHGRIVTVGAHVRSEYTGKNPVPIVSIRYAEPVIVRVQVSPDECEWLLQRDFERV
jgi:hypothetical protein